MATIIRTESHQLSTSSTLRGDIDCTIEFYRRVVRLSATVAMTHWPELGPLRSQERQMALEALIHPTTKRPNVRYGVLDKMPQSQSQSQSHLRFAI